MMSSHNESAGIPSNRKAASSEINSDSVDELLVDLCFLQNQLIGTYVFGPISTRMHPDVLLLSASHYANDASANSANWQSFGSSPTQHSICISTENAYNK